LCTVKKELRDSPERLRKFLRCTEISKYERKIGEHTIKGGKAEKRCQKAHFAVTKAHTPLLEGIKP
jgi:hypothetical protein